MQIILAQSLSVGKKFSRACVEALQALLLRRILETFREPGDGLGCLRMEGGEHEGEQMCLYLFSFHACSLYGLDFPHQQYFLLFETT